MSTLAFPSSHVPIIGQPFQLKGGYPTVLVQCTCEAKAPFLLIANMTNACPACGRAGRIASFSFDAATGAVEAGIQPVTTKPAVES